MQPVAETGWARGQCCGQWQGQARSETGVWSVAWLGVGSARPSFLFGSHFLFSVGGVGVGGGDLQEIKEA